MKTNVTETSLFAYETIKPELRKRQQEVFNAIDRLEYATAKDVSKFLHLPINSITGRINELLYDKQMIKIDGFDFKQRIYSVRKEGEPLNVRKLTPHEKLEQVKTWLRGQGLYVDTGKAIEAIDKIIDEL